MRIESKKSATLRYVIRENRARIVKAKGKQVGNHPILVAECLAVRGTFRMAIQKRLQRVAIKKDIQLVVNSINRKTCFVMTEDHFGRVRLSK